MFFHYGEDFFFFLGGGGKSAMFDAMCVSAQDIEVPTTAQLTQTLLLVRFPTGYGKCRFTRTMEKQNDGCYTLIDFVHNLLFNIYGYNTVTQGYKTMTVIYTV